MSKQTKNKNNHSDNVRKLDRHEWVLPCPGPPTHLSQDGRICPKPLLFMVLLPYQGQTRCKKPKRGSRQQKHISHRHSKTQKMTWYYLRVHYTVIIINLHCSFARFPTTTMGFAWVLMSKQLGRLYNWKQSINMSIE